MTKYEKNKARIEKRLMFIGALQIQKLVESKQYSAEDAAVVIEYYFEREYDQAIIMLEHDMQDTFLEHQTKVKEIIKILNKKWKG